jgi:hypothetical protein
MKYEEITFPSTFKAAYNSYIHCKSESFAIIIYTDYFGDSTTVEQVKHLLGIYEASLEPCEVSEASEAFDRVVKAAKLRAFGITVDLNSNTTTEDLEQVYFKRESESVEMKHDFNK